MNLFCKLLAMPGMESRFRRQYCVHDERLRSTLFGLDFPNPVGLAAGFDKEGRWFNQLAALGFGSIEVGTVTGQAQPGNPKPRLFRLPTDRALINRMGFNSTGCDRVAAQLSKTLATRRPAGVLGINIGKSKVVPLEAAPAEHQKSFERLFPWADYFTINVSSPNTPGLRELQGRDHLMAIIDAVDECNTRLSQDQRVARKPVLLKIAPDLTNAQLDEIAAVAREKTLNGLIATNTTITRDHLKTPPETLERIGAGGLSGSPLHDRSLEVVRRLFQNLQGEVPIIGVGGIMTGTDAWNMIAAGANLVQIYTGFVYGGPPTVRDINRELLRRLDQNGFDHISQAVGVSA